MVLKKKVMTCNNGYNMLMHGFANCKFTFCKLQVYFLQNTFVWRNMRFFFTFVGVSFRNDIFSY